MNFYHLGFIDKMMNEPAGENEDDEDEEEDEKQVGMFPKYNKQLIHLEEKLMKTNQICKFFYHVLGLDSLFFYKFKWRLILKARVIVKIRNENWMIQVKRRMNQVAKRQNWTRMKKLKVMGLRKRRKRLEGEFMLL